MAVKFCPLSGHSCLERECALWVITRVERPSGNFEEFCDCAIARIARDGAAIAWHQGAVD